MASSIQQISKEQAGMKPATKAVDLFPVAYTRVIFRQIDCLDTLSKDMS